MENIVVISSFKCVIGVVSLPDKLTICTLREEFESILDPGNNPCAWDTPVQDEWLEKVHHRECFLVNKYGGAPSDDKPVYGPETFVNWLVQEKDAKIVPFIDYLMAEFD